MKGRLRLAACTAGLLAAVTAGSATAAQPMATWTDQGAGAGACLDGHVCLYAHDDYNRNVLDGTILLTDQDVPDLNRYQFSNTARSVYNNSGVDVVLYDYVDYGGKSLTIRPGTGRTLPEGWTRTVSSVDVLKRGGGGPV
ncbi:peptidase inhibitor family I36 protein [Streptomyces sp. RFCAC02]|uniref:peptidase inhibitor family I36 protein n=1 Tax=Streptomyces sp. RFCAC02 TaxID=2499143 RepID=UPI00143D81E8|nr:peptidase inhibitor family I36 protein [Streptomyces sp. RFCAC02]